MNKRSSTSDLRLTSRAYAFFMEGLYTDVTFLVGNAKIKTHKTILASSSPVFHAMFQSEMQESGSDEVIISDVEEDTFREFLRYIYTGVVNNLDKHSPALMMLADKYEVKQLSLICDDSLENSVTIRNAVEYLKIADLFRRNDLKQRLNIFISKHLEAVMATDGWLELENGMELVSTIFDSAVLTPNSEHGRDKYPSSGPNFSWFAVSGGWPPEWSSDVFGYNYRMVTSIVVVPTADNTVIEIKFETCTKSNILHLYISDLRQAQIDFLSKIKFLFTVRSFPSSQTLSETQIAMSDTLSKNLNLQYASKLSVPQQLLFTLDLNSEPYSLRKFSLTVEILNHYDKPVKNPLKINNEFADAKIQLTSGNSEPIPIHKAVLAGNSSWFSSLFSKEMKTNSDDPYIIENMTSATFEVLKNFMYTNIFPPTEQINLSLLRGAHTFQLDDLVEFCCTALSNLITTENALEIVVASNEMNFEQLKAAAMTFLANNHKNFGRSQKLWDLKKTNFELFNQILLGFPHQK